MKGYSLQIRYTTERSTGETKLFYEKWLENMVERLESQLKEVDGKRLLDFTDWLREQDFTNPDIDNKDWVDGYLNKKDHE